MSHFIFNMFKMWYLILLIKKNIYIFGTGGERVKPTLAYCLVLAGGGGGGAGRTVNDEAGEDD